VCVAGGVWFGGIDNHTFWPLFADWFSEQFSTGVLIVPCMLTVKMPSGKFRYTWSACLPVLALIISVVASVVIGGAGSLAFPLPALIWCAVRYSCLRPVC
jgi:hypothetical protein